MNTNVESLLIFSCLTFIKVEPPGTEKGNASEDPRYIPVLGQKFGSGKTTTSKYFLDMCNLIYNYLGSEKFFLIIIYLRKIIFETNSVDSIQLSINNIYKWVQLLLKNSLESLENNEFHKEMKSIYIYEDLGHKFELLDSIEQILKNGRIYYSIVKKQNIKIQRNILHRLANIKREKNEEIIVVIDELQNCIMEGDEFIDNFNEFRKEFSGDTFEDIHIIFVGRGLNVISNFSEKITGWGPNLYSINIQPLGYAQVKFLFENRYKKNELYNHLDLDKKKLFILNTIRLTSGIPLLVNFALGYEFMTLLIDVVNQNLTLDLFYNTFKKLIKEGTSIYDRSKIDLYSNIELFPLFTKTMILSLCDQNISINEKIGKYLVNHNIKKYLTKYNKLDKVKMDSIISLFPTYISSNNAKVKIIIPPIAPLDPIVDHSKSELKAESNVTFTLKDETISPLQLFSKIEISENVSSFGDSSGNNLKIMDRYLFGSLLAFNNSLEFIEKFIKKIDHSIQINLKSIQTPNKLYYWSNKSGKLRNFDEENNTILDSFPKYRFPKNCKPKNYLPRTTSPSDTINRELHPTNKSHPSNFSYNCFQTLYELILLEQINLRSENPNYYPITTPCIIVEPLKKNSSPDSIFIYAVLDNDKEATLVIISIQDKWVASSNNSEDYLNEEYGKACMFISNKDFLKEKLNRKIKLHHFFFVIKPLNFIEGVKFTNDISVDFPNACISLKDKATLNLDTYKNKIKRNVMFKTENVFEYVFFIDITNINILYGKGFQKSIEKLISGELNNSYEKYELCKLSILPNIF